MWEPSLAGRKLDPYYHVCALFNSRDEEYQVLAPFFKEGLEQGANVVNFVDPDLRTDHQERFRKHGIGVDAYEAKKQLQVLTWLDTYLTDGSFDQDRMLRSITKIVADGREQGFPHTIIMGHMSWVFSGKPGVDQMIEYETRCNDVLQRNKEPAVCVYDLARMSGTMVMDVLRCHPFTLVGGVVHENAFYTPPEEYLEEVRARRLSTVHPASA